MNNIKYFIHEKQAKVGDTWGLEKGKKSTQRSSDLVLYSLKQGMHKQGVLNTNLYNFLILVIENIGICKFWKIYLKDASRSKTTYG